MNKYHPSNKREAKPGSVGVGRSVVSVPGGRGLSEAALSPSASSFVAASAQSMSSRQPAPISSAPPTSTVEAAAKVKAEREEASGAQTANEKPTEDNDTAVPEKDTPAGIPPQQTTVDGAVLKAFLPFKSIGFEMDNSEIAEDLDKAGTDAFADEGASGAVGAGVIFLDYM